MASPAFLSRRVVRSSLERTRQILNRCLGSDMRYDTVRYQSGSSKKLFASVWNFSSRKELMEELAISVLLVDHKAGVVVINKPYGLPLNPSDDCAFSLTSALKDLAAVIEVKHLEPFKVPSRYNSGCAVLVTSENSKTKLEKCRTLNFKSGIFDEKCLAITLGNPRVTNLTEVIDVQGAPIPGKKNFKNLPLKETVISRDLASNRKLKVIKADGGIRAHIRSTTISRSGLGNASMVSLEATTNRNNLYLAYMADLLSPVLGDRFYSYRVKNIMGKPISISHEHSPGMPTPLNLPPWMLSRFNLSQSDADLIPQHIHLARTYYKNFYGKGKPLQVFAPPPKYFQSTISSLGLTFDWEHFKEGDEVIKIDPPDRVKKAKKSKSGVEILHPDDIQPLLRQQLLNA